MTDPQTAAQGSQIIYHIAPKDNMTADNDSTPTIAELLGGLLKLAAEFRSDYRAATAAHTAAINRLASAIEDAEVFHA